MNTKYKILNTALDLFNNNGLDKVSPRLIAENIGISDGNLRYHFKTKELLIIQLYENMLAELDANMQKQKQAPYNLARLLDYIKIGIETQHKYKFILINLVEICRNIELIRKHYREATRRRQEEFHYNVDKLIETGFIIEANDLQHRNNIFAVYHILGNFWAIEADLQGETDATCIVNYFFRVNSSLMIPYLTEKGWEAFQTYFKEPQKPHPYLSPIKSSSKLD